MTKNLALVALFSLALAGTARATFVGDSVADFSSTQGQGSWYYGYYNGTSAYPFTNNPAGDDFQPMTQYLGGDSKWHVLDGVGGYWTAIGATNMHPNGTQANHGGRLPEVQWAVRRWVSDHNGPVEITGLLAMGLGAHGGDGTVGHILINGVDVYTQALLSANETGFNVDMFKFVKVGTVVDFDVNAGAANNDLFDTTRFNVKLDGWIPGDASDHNNKVDGADYTVWADNFGKLTTSGPIQGDFNCDGKVDGADYTIWADNFGTVAAGLPIPEPASVILLLIGTMGLAACLWVRIRKPAR